jgi:hypothetical protein
MDFFFLLSTLCYPYCLFMMYTVEQCVSPEEKDKDKEVLSKDYLHF